jgi:hypothetical protein
MAEQQEDQGGEAVAKSDTSGSELEPAEEPAVVVDTPDLKVEDDSSSSDAAVTEDVPIREVSVSDYVAEENAGEPAEDASDEATGGGSEVTKDAPAPRSTEPALSIASSREEPITPAAKPEIRIESDTNKEPVGQRKGWWSRG